MTESTPQMLEPDVTLTDFALAVQNAVFAWLLFCRHKGDRSIGRSFALLFVALSASALFGGIWHGFFSGGQTALGNWFWLASMTALASAGAVLWSIAALLIPIGPWPKWLRGLAVAQFAVQTLVSALVTDAFWVGAAGMLPATCLLASLYFRDYRHTRVTRILVGSWGLVLAVISGLVIFLDISPDPPGITPVAFYHLLQMVACWLVFRSVPALRSSAE